MQAQKLINLQNQPDTDSELTILLLTVSKDQKTGFLRHSAEDPSIDLYHGDLGLFKS
jgi:hypothetical protein